MSPGPWWALVLELPQRLEDELAGSLAPFSLGAELSPVGAGRSRVTIYVDGPEEGERAARLAREGLRARGLDPESCRLRVERVEDGRWVERHRASLRPFPLGSRFLISPTGAKLAPVDRTVLRLVPGRAFGTGEHATTQLCTERLERWVAPATSWLDVGCGTGVLSIVALHCGAAQVWAIDNDPEAVEVARAVLAENGVTGRVDLRVGLIDELPERLFDGVVINISAEFLEHAADAIAARLRPHGLVVASGFMGQVLREVVRRLEASGLEVVERVEREPWAAVVARVRQREA